MVFTIHLLISLVFSGLPETPPESIRVITYNIRYANEQDSSNSWSERKNALKEQIRYYHPDILGIQEGLFVQVEFLSEQLPSYEYVGIGRDDGKKAGEFSAIFYHRDRLELIREGTFWLSETPEIVSVGWDASMERICTYALFRCHSSKKTFWVFNTHFDHRGQKARSESARLITKKIAQVNTENLPYILLGDLNMLPDDAGIHLLSESMHDTYENALVRKPGPEGTFNGFEIRQEYTNRIDYIFVSPGDFTIESYAAITDLTDGKYLSDHFPILVDLSFLSE
jgi:endonuclease/exonuclease/phosphatase family metal-dependent hydrolase